MEYLPPVGWNDVARRHDVDLLRSELGVLGHELRSEIAGVRAEMAELRADLRVELHRELRVMLVWLVGTIMASVGAVLGLIAFVS